MAINLEQIYIKAEDQTKSAFDSFKRNVQDAGRALSDLQGVLGTLGVAASVGGFVELIKQSRDAAMQLEQTQTRMSALMTAAGGAAGVTQQELETIALQMSKSTEFTKQEIESGEGVLLKFGTIQEDVLTRAIKLSADYAAVTGRDFASAAQAVGQALDSPTNGLRNLQREIGKLTPAQQQAIKDFAEMNDKVGAQGVILDVIAGKIQGVADAMNKGLTKETRDLAKAWEDLLQTIGKTTVASGYVEGLTRTVKTLADIFAQGSLSPGEILAVASGMPAAAGGATASGKIGGADLLAAQVDARKKAEAESARQQAAEEAQLAIGEKASLEIMKDRVSEGDRLQKMYQGIQVELARTTVGSTALSTVETQIAQIDKYLLDNNPRAKAYIQEIEATAKLIDKQHYLAAELDAYIADTKAATDANINFWKQADELTHSFTVAGLMIGKTTLEQQKLTAAWAVDNDVQQARARVLKEVHDPARQEQAIALLEKEADVVKTRLNPLIEENYSRMRQWTIGWQAGMNEVVESTTDAASQAKDLFKGMFQGLEDQLVDFVYDQKANWHDLAEYIIKQLIRIQIQQSVIAPLATLFGSGSGSGGGLGGLLGMLFPNPAGMSSTSTATTFGPAGGSVIPSWMSTGYQSGGSFTVGGSGGPDSQLVAFRATPGERVSIDRQNAGVVIHQTNYIDSRTDQAAIIAAINASNERTKAEILDNMRRGGAFVRAVKQ